MGDAVETTSWEDAKKRALDAVMKNGDTLKGLAEELRADKDVVWAAVKQDAFTLQYASQDLRADNELVLECVRQHGRTLQFASESLQEDEEVVHAAVKTRGRALRFASSKLQANRAICLEAVRQSGLALRFASEDLRADKDVVLEAVRQRGDALKHAGQAPRNSKEVVLEADLMLLARRGDPNEEIEQVFYTFPLKTQALLLDPSFRLAASSAIAVRGEEAPVLTVMLSYTPRSDCSVAAFKCQASMMSGTSFDCSIPIPDDARQVPTLKDLVEKLIEELQQHKVSARAFINFRSDDGGAPIVASPWDWDKPLSDFLPQQDQSRGSESQPSLKKLRTQ